MCYAAKQHLHHDQFGFMVSEEETGRCLGGFGSNYYRPWVFPLYTPRGLTVLQEFPYDHPFHNGFWVAQGPLRFEGRDIQFWPAPPARRPGEPLFTHMGRMEARGRPQIETIANGVCFQLLITWRDEHEQPVIDEQRTVTFYAVGDATICDMTSTKIASYGAVDYVRTKFGSIGIRVEPRLLPVMGGEILADGRRGTAEVALDQECSFVAYENELDGSGRFGVLLTSLDEGVWGPWFIRDYGLAYFNPTRAASIHTARGEAWSVGLRVVAYDGALTVARARAWMVQSSGDAV